jgi:hypothetical protein
MTPEAELRASIQAVGPLVPVLKWLGATIDGRRREAICFEMGILPNVHTCHTLEQACTALWPLHPDRALALAREHAGGHVGLPPTVRELAQLCNVSVSAIAQALDTRPRRKETRPPRRTQSIKTELVKFWCEPLFKHYVRLAGARNGLDLSSTLRVAAWQYVQRELPNAPTEGGRRGPSVEHVRPKLNR